MQTHTTPDQAAARGPRSANGPRRTRVNGRRGIYYRPAANGRRRYEITYRDSDGRQRWKTVAGGLREAEAELEEVRGRMRRGERVAPTRLTLTELVDHWLPQLEGQLRPRTIEAYTRALRKHVLPTLGRLRAADVTEDDVAQLIALLRRKGYSEWTIHGDIVALSRVLGYAVRRGMAAANPVRRLERGERPKPGRREMRILDTDEIGKLIAAAGPRHGALIATAVFTGLRVGELLGLAWRDVDFDAGAVRVRYQLDRKTGRRVEPKTSQARREVVLMPALATLLREQKMASAWKAPNDPVFATGSGAPLGHRSVKRILDRAMKRAGLDSADRPRLRFHDLRHCYASLLIAQAADVVVVSRQLGHSNSSTTLNVYLHLFDRQRHAGRLAAALESGFGELLARASST